VRTRSRLFVGALVAAFAASLAGCYTQVRTAPPPPYPPPYAMPPQFEPEPAPDPIDGEYTGTVLVVDETGHHTGRVRFRFDQGWYRAEVESLPILEGEYQLKDDEVILVEHGEREGTYPWRLAPSGHFELRRTRTGITLVQRLPGRGSFREVLLSPVGEPR